MEGDPFPWVSHPLPRALLYPVKVQLFHRASRHSSAYADIACNLVGALLLNLLSHATCEQGPVGLLWPANLVPDFEHLRRRIKDKQSLSRDANGWGGTGLGFRNKRDRSVWDTFRSKLVDVGSSEAVRNMANFTLNDLRLVFQTPKVLASGSWC